MTCCFCRFSAFVFTLIIELSSFVEKHNYEKRVIVQMVIQIHVA